MPEPVDVERLGQRLHRAREERGLTLERLWKETGVSIATLSRVERGGSKEIDGGTLVQLCRWMGVRPEEFRPGQSPQNCRAGRRLRALLRLSNCIFERIRTLTREPQRCLRICSKQLMKG